MCGTYEGAGELRESCRQCSCAYNAKGNLRRDEMESREVLALDDLKLYDYLEEETDLDFREK